MAMMSSRSASPSRMRSPKLRGVAPLVRLLEPGYGFAGNRPAKPGEAGITRRLTKASSTDLVAV